MDVKAKQIKSMLFKNVIQNVKIEINFHRNFVTKLIVFSDFTLAHFKFSHSRFDSVSIFIKFFNIFPSSIKVSI